jgi:hypothetical protein
MKKFKGVLDKLKLGWAVALWNRTEFHLSAHERVDKII